MNEDKVQKAVEIVSADLIKVLFPLQTDKIAIQPNDTGFSIADDNYTLFMVVSCMIGQ